MIQWKRGDKPTFFVSRSVSTRSASTHTTLMKAPIAVKQALITALQQTCRLPICHFSNYQLCMFTLKHVMCMSGHVHIVQPLSLKEVRYKSGFSVQKGSESANTHWSSTDSQHGVQNTHILWSLLSEVHTLNKQKTTLCTCMFVVLLTQCQHCCNTECGLAPPTNALLTSSLCMVRGISRVMNTSLICTYLTATLTEVSVSEGVDISSATSNNHSCPSCGGKMICTWVRYVTREGTNTDGLNTSIKMLYLAIHVRKKLPKDKWTTYTHIHDSLMYKLLHKSQTPNNYYLDIIPKNWFLCFFPRNLALLKTALKLNL